MSDAVAPPPSGLSGRTRFAIVASRFNLEYVDGLVDHALARLRTGEDEPRVVRVPGAFEIPIVVGELARQRSADAILALAVIIKGHTDHAEHLARAVTDALQRAAVEFSVPVINCVLSVENEEQARERCLGQRINRGTEAADAALEIARVLQQLRAKV